MTCTQTAAVDRTFGDENLETQSRADWDALKFDPDTQQLVTEGERAAVDAGNDAEQARRFAGHLQSITGVTAKIRIL